MMFERTLPRYGVENETNDKILNISTELFAIRGYDAVSLRDIAKAVGIKEPSIYYYYRSKEALWRDVLSRFEAGYRHYFDWLRQENTNTDSARALLDNFFNDEFVNMGDPMGCLGMSLALKEQHSRDLARRQVFDLFYNFSVNSIKADFDRLIDIGALPPSDTKTIATLLMIGVMVTNDIRVHEYLGMQPPVDCKGIYAGLRTMIEMALNIPSPQAKPDH